MDELPRLLQEFQSTARHVSAEDLETFGKAAAAAWADHRYRTLGEAVVEVVKTAALSPEQVKRVVEFANTNAFLTEFRGKTASPNGNGYVDFGPGVLADPGEVLRDLNDGGGGAPNDAPDFRDYGMPPEKTAGELTLEEMFKGAREEVILPDPHRQVMEVREKFAYALEAANSDLGEFESLYFQLAGEIVDQVKVAMLDGGISAGDIVRAWALSGVSPGAVKLAFQALAGRGNLSADALDSSLKKMGSARVVNPNHPLVARMLDYELVLDKLAELKSDIRVLSEGVAVWDNLRAKLGAAELCKIASKEEVIRKGLWPALTESAEKAAPWVADKLRGAASHLVGSESAKSVANAAEKAVKYAPHAAGATVGGLAAYNAGHAAINNPYLQYGASFVPGTPQERMRREQRVMSGMQTAQSLGIPYMPVGV